jgi:very-short-patch-repair endonuclease
VTNSTIAAITKQVAQEAGWRVTNAGEADLALALRNLGYSPRNIETQFNLGPFKLDFAIVAARIDIEADGWVHTTSDVRKRDRLRDRQIREWGWTVIRIDLSKDLREQLKAVPTPGELDLYTSAWGRIRCAVELATFWIGRRRNLPPAESLECVRRAISATCDKASKVPPSPPGPAG